MCVCVFVCVWHMPRGVGGCGASGDKVGAQWHTFVLLRQLLSSCWLVRRRVVYARLPGP